MQEVEGLTVGAIDLVIEGIEAQGGKTCYLWWDYKLCIGCALGSLGFGHGDIKGWKTSDAFSKAVRVGLITDSGDLQESTRVVSIVNSCVFGDPYLSNTHSKFITNDEFERFTESKHNAERGRRMLAWLRDQRALKCSDWTVPVKEVVPDRKAVLA